MTNVIALPDTDPNTSTPDIPAGHITGPDFALRAGLTYRQLDHWTRVGYLTPLQAHPGSGFPRAYPVDQVPLARLMSQFTGAGVSPMTARLVARELLTHGHAVLAGIRLELPQDL